MNSYNPHPNVLPQCAAEISALKTEVRNMRITSEATHKLVTEQVIPTLAVLAARHEKKKSGLLNKIISSTITKALALLLTAIGLALLSLWGCEEDMHRTEGQDWVNEGTPEAPIRRFVNQDEASGIPGTVDPAEWSNAVQEELCNVVELSGGTLATTAAADRAANWRQVYDRIFESEALDSDSIGELTISKLSDGTLDIDSGGTSPVFRLQMTNTAMQYFENVAATDTYYAQLRSRYLTFVRTDGNPSDTATLNVTDGLVIDEWDNAAGSTEIAKTSYQARGVQYTQRFGDSTVLENAVYRKEVYTYEIASWSATDAPIYAAVPIGGTTLELGIPYASGLCVTGAWVQVAISGATVTTPAAVTITNDGTGLAEIIDIRIISSAAPSATTFDVIIEYDAQNLAD